MKHAIICALALITAPLALAHDPPGTPKDYCEPYAEWRLHEYVMAYGAFVSSPTDGNILGDCDNSGTNLGDPGAPCAGFDDPNDPLTFFVGLCDSDIRTPVFDWDGHTEFAYGGAYILACSGDGTAVGTCGNGNGAGSEYCWGMGAHHTEQGYLTVADLVFSTGVTYYVAADQIDTVAANSGGAIAPDPCGDFESDVGQSYNDPNDPNTVNCPTGYCAVSFNAGLDGSYQVYVTGTQGHVDWP